MLRHPENTRQRIAQLIVRMEGLIYPQRIDVSDLRVSGPVARIAYEEAQKLAEFRPAKPGDQFGPAWATFWFRGAVAVPPDWRGQRVDLLWDSQSEATLWVNGRSAQGLNMNQGDRPDAILIEKAAGGETASFQIEMACNNKFGLHGVTDKGMPVISPWHLRRCQIARFDPLAWEMYFDAYVLGALEAALAKEGSSDQRAWQGLLLAELNRFANEYDADNRDTWPVARKILASLYEHHNPQRTFELSAIGHAHIDTAWLWPLAETHRKCERTFSTATTYMHEYPEYRFACSQAYQYDVIRQRNPELYGRIKQAVKAGQFVPVGGTWVEPDCNIPSGESLLRQFLFGQRFFQREFGKRCKEFWNPDVFGYNGQLPQIIRQAGMNRFLTQKLSWNAFNKPQQQTFIWRGIDGSEVLTHFPPADTYNAMCISRDFNEIDSLRANAARFKDFDRANEGYVLYGYGDGGGGPTKRMLEVIRRAADLRGLPRTQQRGSEDFFDRLDADYVDRLHVVGELYFECHRGTYTSQALVKKNNRSTERLLHDLEFAAVSMRKRDGGAYPRAQLEALWQVLLLNQFHDILPGSSITEVYEDSARQFAEAASRGEALWTALMGNGTALVNTIGFARQEVVSIDGQLQYVAAEPFAAAQPRPMPPAVKLTRGQQIVLANEHLRAVFSTAGRLVSLVQLPSEREALAGSANVFELYEDLPISSDAWDVDPVHMETVCPCEAAQAMSVVQESSARVEIAFDYRLSPRSSLRQIIRLDAGSARLEFHCSVDWHESHRMLKVAFPISVLASNATYQMQFGHVERPTHYSTSFDLARFEVPMHQWFDLGEHGFGMAILNDCKYGGSVFDNVMRLSLLRSPKSPDPQCDMGSHTFSYALFPHPGNWRDAGVVAEAARFNSPLRTAKAASDNPLAHVDDANLVLDTIKGAEDSDGVVLRLYECHGARGTSRIRLGFAFKTALFCNAMEDLQEKAQVVDGAIEVPYRPHQIISLMIQ